MHQLATRIRCTTSVLINAVSYYTLEHDLIYVHKVSGASTKEPDIVAQMAACQKTRKWKRRRRKTANKRKQQLRSRSSFTSLADPNNNKCRRQLTVNWSKIFDWHSWITAATILCYHCLLPDRESLFERSCNIDHSYNNWPEIYRNWNANSHWQQDSSRPSIYWQSLCGHRSYVIT